MQTTRDSGLARMLGALMVCVGLAACGGDAPAPDGGAAGGGAAEAGGQVVLYTSLNEPTARSVLDVFEAETGIEVVLQSDTERDKTVGLVQTLIEEKDNPRADVFWNSEVANTVRLKIKGVLAKADPPPANAERIPDRFKDAEGFWYGFAGRARVLIVNTDLVAKDAYPTSMWHLIAPEWKGKGAIVRPVTGTTLTHVTALYEALGKSKMHGFLTALPDNDVSMPPGNGRLAKLVGEGELHFGFTDTSDYRLVKAEGKPVDVVYPDQIEGGLGTLLIPNSVALVAGGPNPANGRRLMEFLLSDECERILAHHQRGHIPLKPGIDHPPEVKVPGDFQEMFADFNVIGAQVEQRLEQMGKLFR